MNEIAQGIIEAQQSHQEQICNHLDKVYSNLRSIAVNALEKVEELHERSWIITKLDGGASTMEINSDFLEILQAIVNTVPEEVATSDSELSASLSESEVEVAADAKSHGDIFPSLCTGFGGSNHLATSDEDNWAI